MSGSKIGFLTRSALLMLVLIGIVFLATGVSAVEDGSAQGAGAPAYGKSPVNPLFIKYIAEKQAGRYATLPVTTEGHKLGYKPSPLSYYVTTTGTSSGNLSAKEGRSAYPATYDLRTAGKVSPVKNQDPWGTCWAFATMGSLESTMMPREPAPDFSEQNLANFAGFDSAPPDDGGDAAMSMAYLTRWNGPVNEDSDPYSLSTWTDSSSFTSERHVQNAYYIPYRTTRSLATTGYMKKALTEYGAVFSAFYWADKFWDEEDSSYYQPPGAADPTTSDAGGHAVTIVGWDDNFPRTYFNNLPAGKGAWLVKNSWDTTWGEDGYFWISYYDKYFASAKNSVEIYESAVFLSEDAANYNMVYSYDKLGEVSDYWYGTKKTGTFANEFTAKADGTLKAAGFYTTDMNATVKIKVYKNPTLANPESGTLVSTLTGVKLPNRGYNTVVLTTQPPLTKGDRFSVVVTVRNPTNINYIPAEENMAGYSRGVVSYLHEGYVKSGTTWKDWHTLMNGWGYGDSHICLKAYTS